MPNREAHSIIGASSGAIVAVFIAWEEPNFDQVCYIIGGGIGGYGGSFLPDIFEPADNPHHRKFFHSIVFNSLLAISLITSKFLYKAARKIARFGWDRKQEAESAIEKFFWSALSISIMVLAGAWSGATVGYLSHVAADSMTSSSIPLI